MSTAIKFYDAHPGTGDLRREVISGLAASPKSIPPRFFYDRRDSELFDAICELPEYYQTRTEMGILRNCVAEFVEHIGRIACWSNWVAAQAKKSVCCWSSYAHQVTWVWIFQKNSCSVQQKHWHRIIHGSMCMRPVLISVTHWTYLIARHLVRKWLSFQGPALAILIQMMP